jgi:delta1-piperideine-2-carboxylate reductase
MLQQAGQEVPPGCAVDRDGRPTTDPATALDGAQLTFGQHKGSAIAMMVELLSAGMSASDFSFDAREKDVDLSSATPTLNSELVIALDPTQVGGLSEAAVLAHCERLYERILVTDGTQLPSTGRHCGSQRFEYRAETDVVGATVPDALVQEVEALIADPALITNPYFEGVVEYSPNA